MKIFRLFNISFMNGDYDFVIERLKKGGLMVVPSGPGLATIGTDLRYTEAVQKADFAIPDSGYMILLLRLLKRINIQKLSGYDFLRCFFSEKINKYDLFLIDPNEEESNINNLYLNKIGLPIDETYQYLAPIYGKGQIIDDILIDRLNSLKYKPKYIMINLGSGVQEPLGYYLKQKLNFKPGIICTGAAIAFFTGRQADVSIADKYYLGWLKRCIEKPRIFIPRYLKAFKLFSLILKSKIEIIK